MNTHQDVPEKHSKLLETKKLDKKINTYALLEQYSRIARQCSLVSFINSSWFCPVFHNKSQLPQSHVYFWIVMQKLCINNSQNIIDAYIARDSSSWVLKLHNRNPSTCQSLCTNVIPEPLRNLYSLHDQFSHTKNVLSEEKLDSKSCNQTAPT